MRREVERMKPRRGLYRENERREGQPRAPDKRARLKMPWRLRAKTLSSARACAKRAAPATRCDYAGVPASRSERPSPRRRSIRDWSPTLDTGRSRIRTPAFEIRGAVRDSLANLRLRR